MSGLAFPARLAFLRLYGCFLLTLASSSTAAIIVERIGAEVGAFTSHPRWSWRQSYLYRRAFIAMHHAAVYSR
jgi:hypothetical protein